jgi:hypothetical protein
MKSPARARGDATGAGGAGGLATTAGDETEVGSSPFPDCGRRSKLWLLPLLPEAAVAVARKDTDNGESTPLPRRGKTLELACSYNKRSTEQRQNIPNANY